MPHINLIYPFVESSSFGVSALSIAKICKEVQPFWVSLDEFGHFKQRKALTVHLKPRSEPKEDLIQELRRKIFETLLPHLKENRAFNPHLTVAQFPKSSGEADIKRLQEVWNKQIEGQSSVPLDGDRKRPSGRGFMVTHIYMISRVSQTAPFRVRVAIPLKGEDPVGNQSNNTDISDEDNDAPGVLTPISEKNEMEGNIKVPDYP
mmetsp:Transcript_19716/g.27530  ORF Transcript_19716/g.27530 Transcript_19716/m.27530 type:complete len:205 (-) Transcript_19716:82-696(-)